MFEKGHKLCVASGHGKKSLPFFRSFVPISVFVGMELVSWQNWQRNHSKVSKLKPYPRAYTYSNYQSAAVRGVLFVCFFGSS